MPSRERRSYPAQPSPRHTTWTRYEEALAELEGGHAVLFSSGMAAVTAALLPRLRPGDTLVLPSDCYHGVR